jgi:hypothetical protein
MQYCAGAHLLSPHAMPAGGGVSGAEAGAATVGRGEAGSGVEPPHAPTPIATAVTHMWFRMSQSTRRAPHSIHISRADIRSDANREDGKVLRKRRR